MLFTVDEARNLKPMLATIKEFENEYGIFSSIVNAFTVWFFILTTFRAIVVSTVIVSMFDQETDLTVAWKKGDGISFFLLYLIVTCLPVIGNFVVVFVPIVVVFAAFVVGDGIVGNFAPFVLPIAIAYTLTFGLIFFSNCLINSIVRVSCPNLYKVIEMMSMSNGYTNMAYTKNVQARNVVNEEESNIKSKKEVQSENNDDKHEIYDDDEDDML